jgi:hypothetical protein
MTADTHPPRTDLAAAETREALVDLLVGQVDRAYTTAGAPGVLAAVRDLLRQFSTATLTTMVYEAGLAAEPARESEPEERR